MAKRRRAEPDETNGEILQNEGENGKTSLLNIAKQDQFDWLCSTRLQKTSTYCSSEKKTIANECRSHRAISLMPHATKCLLKTVQRRIRSNPENESVEERFGFRSGTSEGIFTLQTLCERAVEMQNEVFICFVDYEKMFDEELLEGQNVGRNNIIIKNLYWTHKVAARVDGQISSAE